MSNISQLLRARSPDKLLHEAADLIDYLEAQDCLLSKAQDEAARLRAELAEVKRPLHEQMARLNANLTAANERIAELEAVVRHTQMPRHDHNWRTGEPAAPKAIVKTWSDVQMKGPPLNWDDPG